MSQDILKTVNHTTLEALGFRHRFKGLPDPRYSDVITSEGYKLGGLIVVINPDASVSMTLNDTPVAMDLEQIITFSNSYRNR